MTRQAWRPSKAQESHPKRWSLIKRWSRCLAQRAVVDLAISLRLEAGGANTPDSKLLPLMMAAVNAVARRSYELLAATLQQLALVDELARRIGLPFHRNTHAISLASTMESNRIISCARKVSRPCGETFATSHNPSQSALFRGAVSVATRPFGNRGE